MCVCCVLLDYEGLDYKMLMCGYDVEEVLRPVLTSSNVHVFAKTSNCIPVQVFYWSVCLSVCLSGKSQSCQETRTMTHLIVP